MLAHPARLVIAGAVVLAAACGSDGDHMARIGDRRVSAEAFQEHIVAVTGAPWESVSDAVASRMLDQFIDQQVLIAAAARDPDSDLPIGPGERMDGVRRLVEVVCGSPPEPSEDDVIRDIEATSSTVRPVRARVRQLLLDSLEKAEAVRRQLDEGADFVELSRRVSRAPNAETGGDLGLLSQGGLSDDLDSVIFSLEAEEISEPVSGPSGYHIFQVLEVVPSGPPPRAELELEARRRLAEASARQHAAACIRELAGGVGVEIDRDRLWFDYRGRYAQ